MSAWKKLNQQDAFVTTYVAKKSHFVSASNYTYFYTDKNPVKYYAAERLEGDIYYPTGSDLFSGSYKPLVYRSLEQLYYKSYQTSSGTITGSFAEDSGSYNNYDHYLESSFSDSGSRFLSGSLAMVYCIPQKSFGTHIEPLSFRFDPSQGSFNAQSFYIRVQDDYISASYFERNAYGYYGGLEPIIDDGEGNLMISGSSKNRVGNIIYSHGQVILTDQDVAQFMIASQSANISWKSNQPIYTYNYDCKISDDEYNFTQNPSALTGSDNRMRDNVTGSAFVPYITSVGLYNDAQELIAVGKLGQPLPKPANTELTIKIKLDI
jgi:hypothetical protein